MYPQSKRDEYLAKQKQLAEALTNKDALVAAKEVIERELAAIPLRSRDASVDMRRADLRVSLLQVQDGVRPEDGIGHPALAPLVGKPGTAQTELLIVRLERECAELHEHITRWPTPETRHPYRYKGKPYKAVVDGQELMPGDVVALSEIRAAANADLFDPV